MTIEELKIKKAAIEKERDDFIKQANAQAERYAGALVILDQLIAEMEQNETTTSTGTAGDTDGNH